MELNNDKRIFLQFASVLGMLQALAWSLMSITAIAVFLKQPKLEYEIGMSYERFVSLNIYDRFLFDKELDPHKETIINATEFQIFMWFYLILNLCWFINSYLLFLGSRISSHYSSEQLRRKMKFWSGNTLLVCLLDFIFVCLLGRDYDHCHLSILMDEISFGLVCHLTVGIVLTLAAKGFVLWFINFGLALTTSYFKDNIIMTQQGNNGPFRPYLSIPRIPERKANQPSTIPFVSEPEYGHQPEISLNYGQVGQQPNNFQSSQPASYGQNNRLTNYGQLSRQPINYGQSGQSTNFGSMNPQSRY